MWKQVLTPELFKVAQNLEAMKLVVKIVELDIVKIRIRQPVKFLSMRIESSFEAFVNKN